jgi:hypothetical protein
LLVPELPADVQAMAALHLLATTLAGPPST